MSHESLQFLKNLIEEENDPQEIGVSLLSDNRFYFSINFREISLSLTFSKSFFLRRNLWSLRIWNIKHSCSLYEFSPRDFPKETLAFLLARFQLLDLMLEKQKEIKRRQQQELDYRTKKRQEADAQLQKLKDRYLKPDKEFA